MSKLNLVNSLVLSTHPRHLWRGALAVVVLSSCLACPGPVTPDGGEPEPEPEPEPSAVNVVVNELMALNDTTFADEAGEFEDWVELRNDGDAAADLGGFSMSDDILEPTKFVFPDGTTIGAGEYLLVWADKDVEQGSLHADFKLSGGGETVFLFSAEGRVVSEMPFGPQVDEVAFGRPNDTGAPTFLQTATPRETNSDALTSFPDGGTPEPDDGGEPLDGGGDDAGVDGGPIAIADVRINELVPLNTSGLVDEEGEFENWVELVNLEDGPVSLDGYGLKDDGALINRWFFPSDMTLAAGEFRVFFADGEPSEGPTHADIDLSGGELTLVAPDATTVDSITWAATAADEALGRIPDGTGDFEPTTPTPGLPNEAVDAGPGPIDGGSPSDGGFLDGGPIDGGAADAG